MLPAICSSTARQELVMLAKVCDSAKLYTDMHEVCLGLVLIDTWLTAEERSLLVVSFDNVLKLERKGLDQLKMKQAHLIKARDWVARTTGTSPSNAVVGGGPPDASVQKALDRQQSFHRGGGGGAAGHVSRHLHLQQDDVQEVGSGSQPSSLHGSRPTSAKGSRPTSAKLRGTPINNTTSRRLSTAQALLLDEDTCEFIIKTFKLKKVKPHSSQHKQGRASGSVTRLPSGFNQQQHHHQNDQHYDSNENSMHSLRRDDSLTGGGFLSAGNNDGMESGQRTPVANSGLGHSPTHQHHSGPRVGGRSLGDGEDTVRSPQDVAAAAEWAAFSAEVAATHPSFDTVRRWRDGQGVISTCSPAPDHASSSSPSLSSPPLATVLSSCFVELEIAVKFMEPLITAAETQLTLLCYRAITIIVDLLLPSSVSRDEETSLFYRKWMIEIYRALHECGLLERFNGLLQKGSDQILADRHKGVLESVAPLIPHQQNLQGIAITTTMPSDSCVVGEQRGAAVTTTSTSKSPDQTNHQRSPLTINTTQRQQDGFNNQHEVLSPFRPTRVTSMLFGGSVSAHSPSFEQHLAGEATKVGEPQGAALSSPLQGIKMATSQESSPSGTPLAHSLPSPLAVAPSHTQHDTAPAPATKLVDPASVLMACQTRTLGMLIRSIDHRVLPTSGSAKSPSWSTTATPEKPAHLRSEAATTHAPLLPPPSPLFAQSQAHHHKFQYKSVTNWNDIAKLYYELYDDAQCCLHPHNPLVGTIVNNYMDFLSFMPNNANSSTEHAFSDFGGNFEESFSLEATPVAIGGGRSVPSTAHQHLTDGVAKNLLASCLGAHTPPNTSLLEEHAHEILTAKDIASSLELFGSDPTTRWLKLVNREVAVALEDVQETDYFPRLHHAQRLAEQYLADVEIEQVTLPVQLKVQMSGLVHGDGKGHIRSPALGSPTTSAASGGTPMPPHKGFSVTTTARRRDLAATPSGLTTTTASQSLASSLGSASNTALAMAGLDDELHAPFGPAVTSQLPQTSQPTARADGPSATTTTSILNNIPSFHDKEERERLQFVLRFVKTAQLALQGQMESIVLQTAAVGGLLGPGNKTEGTTFES